MQLLNSHLIALFRWVVPGLLSVLIMYESNADGITSIARNNKLIRQGEEAMKNKDWNTAIKAYKKLIDGGGEIPGQAYLNLGNAYFENKNAEEAQKTYLASVGLLENPALKSVAYQQLGNLQFEKKDYKSSMEWYKRSLKSNPANGSARFNYELAYKLNQKQEEEKQKENPKSEPEKEKEKQKDPKEEKKQGKNQPEKGKDQDKNDKQQPGKDKNKPDKNEKEQNKKGNQDQKGEEKESENGPNQDKEKDKTEEADDKNAKEDSKSKNSEAQAKDAEASKVDKEKLKEIGLSEDQAKALLQAMRQSEVKYLQQRRFGSKKGGKTGKSRW